MTDWVAWLGLVGTVVFGVLSLALGVWQLIQYFVDRKVRDATKKHVAAMKNSVQALRQMCAEAIDTKEIIKSDPERQFVRQVAWNLLGIEGHIDALLDIEHVKPRPANQRLRGVLNEWIMSGNAVIQRIKDDPGVADPARPSYATEARVRKGTHCGSTPV